MISRPNLVFLLLGVLVFALASWTWTNFVGILGTVPASRTPKIAKSPMSISFSYINFTAVEGFFMQADSSIEPNDFEYYAKHHLGLIDRSYDTDQEFDPDHMHSQWQRFQHYVEHLRQISQSKSRYKVLFLGRHGQGYHNVAETKYGTRAWDPATAIALLPSALTHLAKLTLTLNRPSQDYWSKLDGDGNMTWSDAHLTDLGIAQARKVHAFWASETTQQGMSLPQSYYVSPLYRCLQTASYTFEDLRLPSWPTVKELLRERNGVHTCDRRSTRTLIHSSFPRFVIEAGFTEQDELWTPDRRETDVELVGRMQRELEHLFIHDENDFISLTAHSGAIHGILRAVRHPDFPLDTGGVIPVFVKGEASV